MLANGAKLGYSATTSSSITYTDLPGLKEIPDWGVEPELVDNTCLTDGHTMNEMGIGSLPSTVYKFKYDNSATTSPYRVLRDYADDGTKLYWQETLKDGTKTTFSGVPAVKRLGGAVNGVIDFELTIAVDSEITVTDPA